MDEVTIEPTRHKLDVDAYHRMAGAGIWASTKVALALAPDIIVKLALSPSP